MPIGSLLLTIYQFTTLPYLLNYKVGAHPGAIHMSFFTSFLFQNYTKIKQKQPFIIGLFQLRWWYLATSWCMSISRSSINYILEGFMCFDYQFHSQQLAYPRHEHYCCIRIGSKCQSVLNIHTLGFKNYRCMIVGNQAKKYEHLHKPN